MNGWIRIGTKIEKEKFEVQYKQLMIELQELEEKNKSLEETMNDNRGAIQTIADEIKKVNEGLLDEEQIYDRMVGLIETFGGGIEETFVNLAENMSIEEAYAKTLEILQGGITDELKEQEKQYTKNDLKIKGLNIRTEELKNKTGDVTNKTNLFGKEGKQAYNGLLKGARNLVLGIIGIQSAYSLVKRAVSSYLATDENLTSQMKSNWIGLGVILKPIIEYIVNGLKKIVTGVLYLFSILTKRNLIQEANTAILKKQTKATNDLKKANDRLNASFDEMEVLQDNTNKNETDNEPTPSLFNINDLSQNTIDRIKRIAEALQPIYNIVKGLIDWALDNPEVVVTILGGLALLSFLKKVFGVSGMGGSGLLGILFLLETIWAMKELIDGAEKYNEATDYADELQDTRMKQYEKTKNQLWEESANAVNTRNQTKLTKTIKEMKNQTMTLLDNAKSVKQVMNSMSAGERYIAKQSGEWDRMNEEIELSIQWANDYINRMDAIYKLGVLNEEQTNDYREALQYLNEELVDNAKQGYALMSSFERTEDAKEIITNLKDKFFDLNKQIAQAKRDAGSLNDAIEGLLGDKNINVKSSSAKSVQGVVDTTLKGLQQATGKTWKINVKYNTEVNVNTLLNGVINKVANTALWALALSNIQTQWNDAIKMIGLANGGIVHNPGRGVPLGSNILVGEGKDAEAVLPLNEQTYSMLGKSIAENMVVNLTNITEMNGRQINKEIKQISANDNYAFNV